MFEVCGGGWDGVCGGGLCVRMLCWIGKPHTDGLMGLRGVGEALVRQDRLFSSTRALGDGVDAAYFECGSGGGGESEWGRADDVGVSGEG